jgi:hypothetical protein
MATKTKLTVSGSTRKLHKKDVAACKKAAGKYWAEELLNQIINLEWNEASLNRLGKNDKASAKEINMLIDLHNASKLEFSSFAVNHINK